VLSVPSVVNSDGIQVRTLTEGEDALWERGLSESNQESFLNWLPWLRCAGRHLGGHTVLGLERAGRLIAGLAGLVEESHGCKRLRTLYLTAYHGLWVADRGLRGTARESLMRDVAQALIPHLDANWDRWAFSSAPELLDTRPFSDAGCGVEVQFTYRLDLDEPEALLARIDREARREIQRAGQAGTTVEACAPTAENFRAFEETMRDVAERQGWTEKQFPEGMFVDLARLVQEARCGQLFLARNAEGRVAASLVAAWDRQRSYLLLGGGHPELTKSGATRLLYWRVFQWLRENGHREVDLLGANYRNLRLQKRRWNARLEPYFTVTGSNALRMSRLGHLRAAAKHLLRAVTL
jgi:hypothetical protein